MQRKKILAILIGIIISIAVHGQKKIPLKQKMDSLKADFETARVRNGGAVMFQVTGELWQFENLIYFCDNPEDITPRQRKDMALFLRSRMRPITDTLHK